MEEKNLLFMQADTEAEGWKKTLCFLKQQNILQKNKLAEILRSNGQKNETLLEMAEQYQNQFLQQDEAFRFMWDDLAALERSIKKETPKDEYNPKEISCKKEKLRNEITHLEINFDKLKRSFDIFFEALV